MTKTTVQATAAVLSAIMTLAIVAGANGIATGQYAAASERVAQAGAAATQVAAVQRVVIVGHRANA